MNKLPVRPDAGRAMQAYGDLLFRICCLLLDSTGDAEDAVQETFLQYVRSAPDFTGPDHERAWLITVAKNKCRDQLRARARHPQIPLDTLAEQSVVSAFGSDVLDALMTLPPKFRLVLILHYVEGYTTGEIAQIIQKTPSAVKMRLFKGRKLLEEALTKGEIVPCRIEN